MSSADLGRVVSVWRRAFPERFWVDEDLVAFNGVGLCESATFVRDEGFVLVKRSEQVAFVSALGSLNVDVGIELLEESRRALRELHVDQWQFGGDRRHFFPGLPEECSILAGVLSANGFVQTGAPCFDVERDLVDYEPPVPPSTFATLCSFTDRRALTEFFDREFPGRWKDDTLEKFDEDPSRIVGLFIDDKCEGFAMTQRDGDENRRAGAVWSHDLGPDWAALGPIGVSRSVRGHGHGHALLAWALCSLRDQGARRTIIDWTTLTGFYARHGFGVARTYATWVGRIA